DPLKEDTYVYGGIGNDRIHLDTNLQSQFVATGPRLIDGGSGDNVLIVPYAESSYSLTADPSGGMNLKYQEPGTLIVDYIATLENIRGIIFDDVSFLPLDGTSSNVQQPRNGQTQITVDQSYDYTDAGDASVTINGSGLGGDIIALGAGNDVIHE